MPEWFAIVIRVSRWELKSIRRRLAKYCPLFAHARLQLGRAKAMGGDKEGARKDYQDFLAIWKDADAGIPLLKAARAEYEKLK